jgi:hypothetical protein
VCSLLSNLISSCSCLFSSLVMSAFSPFKPYHVVIGSLPDLLFLQCRQHGPAFCESSELMPFVVKYLSSFSLKRWLMLNLLLLPRVILSFGCDIALLRLPLSILGSFPGDGVLHGDMQLHGYCIHSLWSRKATPQVDPSPFGLLDHVVLAIDWPGLSAWHTSSFK